MTLIGICISAILAEASQSGRRVQKSTPVPVATPEPTPSPKPAAEKPKPAINFIIGMARYDGFRQIPLYAYAGVLRSLEDRLTDDKSVKVETVHGDMNRSDAINRAKSEKEAYVVWVQLRPDTMGDDDNADLSNLYVGYSVYAPATAKLVTQGKTYPPVRRNKSIILPKSGSVYGDDLLNQAAREAAERILAALKIPGRPIPG
jgi:hypothetical protein